MDNDIESTTVCNIQAIRHFLFEEFESCKVDFKASAIQVYNSHCIAGPSEQWQSGQSVYNDYVCNNPSQRRKLTYTAKRLKQFKSSHLASSSLCEQVKKNVCELGIKRRFRGKRGGKHSGNHINTRSWDINHGIHHQLLKSLQKVPTVYEYGKKLSIGTVNTRSIKPKCDEIVMNLVTEDIDLLTVTETWLCEADESFVKKQFEDAGYRLINYNREGRIGGGVALITKDIYPANLLSKGCTPSFEYATTKVSISAGKTIYVTVVYRPPNSPQNRASVSQFLEEFSDYISESLSSFNNYIVCGDINIHLDDLSDSGTRNFNNITESFGMTQHVNCITHTSGHTIDIIMAKLDQGFGLSDPVATWLVSDHWQLLAELNIEKGRITREEITKRNFKDIDDTKLEDEIKKIVEESEQIPDNELVNYYNKSMTTLLDKVAPLKKKKVTKRNRPKWMTDELIMLKKGVRAAERKYRKKKKDAHKTTWLELLRDYRKCLRATKHKHINLIFQECGKDSGRLFKAFKGVTMGGKSNPLPESTDDKGLANEFNEFFQQKVAKIKSQLDGFPRFTPNEEPVSQLHTFSSLSVKEVKKILGSTKVTSCRTDPIPTKVIKDKMDLLLPMITRIVNASLDSGVYHESWKCATIIPLLKKSNLDHVLANYRPVNTLPYLGKIVEKCMLKRLNEHLEEHSLLPDYLSAYRTGYSTESVVLTFITKVLNSMDSQKLTLAVAIDLSAAFDLVDHQILLSVLTNKFGVCDSAVKWVKSYLEDRSVTVCINNAISSEKGLECSVPQGSCSGPVLYNLYASTLQEFIKDDITQILGYADDHLVYDSFKAGSYEQEKKCISSLENGIDRIKQWMRENRMKMNDSKTETIMFGNRVQRQKSEISVIRVGEESIKLQSSIKYLGVYIDETLEMKEFIKSKCKSASMNLRLIGKVRTFLNKKNTEQLVNSLVTSILDHSNSVLCNLPRNTIRDLERIQHWAAKLVLRKPRITNSLKCLKDLHWLPVVWRIKFKVCCLMHKCTYNAYCPEYLKQLVCRRKNTRTLRSNDEILYELPKVQRPTYGGRAFSFAGPQLWNMLPKDIKSTEDFTRFKRNLKTHYFTKAFENAK
jgi:exonuclease III